MKRLLVTGFLISVTLICPSCSKGEKNIPAKLSQESALLNDENLRVSGEVVRDREVAETRDEVASWDVREISTQEEFDALFTEGYPVAVKFYGSFCSPCHRMKPIFAKLAKEFTGQVIFAAIEVQQPGVSSLARAYASHGVPSFVTFDAEANYLGTRLGATAEAVLSRFIADHCLGEAIK